MDVTRIGRAIGTYGTFNPATAKKHIKTESNGDTFTLSNAAKDFQVIKNTLSHMSETRPDIVELFRERVNSGGYAVDTDAIADRFVAVGMF